jgi:hypothetical protein
MAVQKIFDGYTLSSGNAASAELTAVKHLALQATVASSTDNVQITYYVKALQGSGAYTNVIKDGKPLMFTTQGNGSYWVTFLDIEAAKLKVYIVVGGKTGTLTLESTQSAATVA